MGEISQPFVLGQYYTSKMRIKCIFKMYLMVVNWWTLKMSEKVPYGVYSGSLRSDNNTCDNKFATFSARFYCLTETSSN